MRNESGTTAVLQLECERELGFTGGFYL